MTEVSTIVDIMRLKQQCLSKRAVARRLGVSRDTVRKYWDCTHVERGRYSPRSKVIDPYCDYITARLEKYPELSSQQLFDEITRQGFKGSYRTVRHHVASIRPRDYREYKPFETLPGDLHPIIRTTGYAND